MRVLTVVRRMHWSAYRRIYDRLWDNQLTDAVADAVLSQLDPGVSVEEVGAGSGLITIRLAAAGCAVSASEPDPLLRRRLQARCPDVPVAARALEELSLDGPSAPQIVAVNVLHLCDDPAAVLKRLRARAGPAGRVVVATPVAGISLTAVARAQLAAGVPMRRVAWFLATHVGMGPLTVLASAGLPARPDVPDHDARRTLIVSGVTTILTFGQVYPLPK